MDFFSRCLWGAARRVWPDCVTQAQAAAFNMFLAFLPMLLLVLGLVSSWEFLRLGVEEMVVRMGPLLPPGTVAILREFLQGHVGHPSAWISLGLGGTLLAGTQMMRLLIEGFHITHRIEKPDLREQIGRALLLLCITIAPTVLAVVIVVFGKQMRITMTQRFGLPVLIRILWAVVLTSAALSLAMIVLTVVYSAGTRGARKWRDEIPGAIVATPLWWLASWLFGVYMRHVPYSIVYGGFATAIGLMIWMNLTAVIILLGSAYNAERAELLRMEAATAHVGVLPRMLYARDSR
jgi:membrane protein